MKIDRRWARSSQLEAIRNNLAFWAVQPISAQRNDANNVHQAIQHGLMLSSTRASIRASAARVLSQSFSLAQSQPGHWLPLYVLALRNKQLPSRLRAELHYQQAVLYWLLDDGTQAAQAFQRGLRLARQLALPTLQARNLIGLCLVHSQDPARASKTAQQLTQVLAATRHKGLQAHAFAALGYVAYFARQYSTASEQLAAAIQAAPASLARGQLHTLAGLSALAEGQADAALRHYNAAALLLQRHQASASQLARLELLRATAHYHKSTRGQRVRLQPAIAALQRAAVWLAEGQVDAASRSQLESLLGRAYTRSGDVASGLRYLASALQLSEDAGEHNMAADIFAALQQLESKNPA
ncbi:MAG: hypothetical protein KIS88_00230 [Anaerolineales bacterium]|nr:hypothetical protein [Anaerolineales bacterium]